MVAKEGDEGWAVKRPMGGFDSAWVWICLRISSETQTPTESPSRVVAVVAPLLVRAGACVRQAPGHYAQAMLALATRICDMAWTWDMDMDMDMDMQD